MKIVVPMAGEGSRFVQGGYTFPKPLIEVNGVPMIQAVVSNLRFDDAEYIFLVRKAHLQKFTGVEQLLHQVTNNRCKIVVVDQLTQGAACTVLLAKHLINDDDELLIANSDQLLEFSKTNFTTLKSLATTVEGLVFTFTSTHPKWSFVRVNSQGHITEIVEKLPISDVATCGVYWYRRGKDFVAAAERMIEKNIRVNGEFYVAPVYNELIAAGKLVVPFYVQEMHGIGTPEDLELYLQRNKTNVTHST